jgi:hypothetical protein
MRIPARAFLMGQAALLALAVASRPATAAAPAAPATQPADARWTVLFRSDNPALWNTAAGKPTDANGYAILLAKTPPDTRYFRLKRMDTGEYVILRGSISDLSSPKGPLTWSNGTQTWAAGDGTGYLLGIVDHADNTSAVDRVVQLTTQNRSTAGYQGWGFGRVLGNASVQGYSWAGKRLGKTVFEVSVTAAKLTEDERAWVLSPGATTLVAATWGNDDDQENVKDTIQATIHGAGISLRANAATLGKPNGPGPHYLRILFNIDGEDHYRVYKEGEAVGILGFATRTLSQKERAPGELSIISAEWTAADHSVDVTGKLSAAVKKGALELDATVANLGDPGAAPIKTLEVHYDLGGRHLVGRYAENEHVSLGEQIVPVIEEAPLPQDRPLADAAEMKSFSLASASGGGSKSAEGGLKKLGREQATIKSLSVLIDEDGRMLGNAEDFILTATPGSPRENTPVDFVGKAGPEMKGVRDDVLRYLHVKYPKWPASKVDLTFEDRGVSRDGGSIGAAVGTLLLAVLQGFDVDSHVAITGDVSADGKVRPIGGVSAKLRGAAAAGCTIVLIPEGNLEQLTDAVVYEGDGLLINTHVIGIANLDEAAAAARTDRPEQVAAAIKLFDGIRPDLKKFPLHVHTKAVQDVLQQILTLVPDDYSAKLLLAIGQNKEPRKLSSTATLYYMAVAEHEVAPTLFDRSKVAALRSSTTPVAVQKGLQELYKLRGIGALDVMPLLDAEVRLIQGVNSVETGIAAPQTVLPLIQSYEDAAARLNTDRNFQEKLLKEGI